MSFRTMAADGLCTSCRKKPEAWPGTLCLECKQKRQAAYQKSQAEKYAGMTSKEIDEARAQAMAEGSRKGARTNALKAQKKREALEAEGLKLCPRCGIEMGLYDGYYCQDCKAWDRERKSHGR